LVALQQRCIRRSLGGRLGAFAAVFVVLLGSMIVAVDHQADPTQRFERAIMLITRVLLWFAIGPMALSIAGLSPSRGRAEGLEALAIIRGNSPGQLAAGRKLAAMSTVAARLGLFSVLMCLLVAAVSWQGWGSLLLRGAHLVAFALVCGVVIGGIAALCAEYAGRYGRVALLAVVLIPWVIADVVNRPVFSLPGALDGLLATLVALSSLPGPAL